MQFLVPQKCLITHCQQRLYQTEKSNCRNHLLQAARCAQRCLCYIIVHVTINDEWFLLAFFHLVRKRRDKTTTTNLNECFVATDNSKIRRKIEQTLEFWCISIEIARLCYLSFYSVCFFFFFYSGLLLNAFVLLL